MARRSKSKSKSHLPVYIIIAVAVVAALIAGKIILGKRAQHFTELKDLPVSDYRENANSYSGNEYRVTGKVIEILKVTSKEGRLITLSVEQKNNTNIDLPVFIPNDISQGASGKVNIERGQSYSFKVEISRKINREGLAIALEVKAQ